MTYWVRVTTTIMALGAAAAVYAAQTPPIPENPQQAQTALGFNVSTRCPELRIVDGGNRAVVLFWVPKRGVQSQIAIKTSSGSSELDAAATSCVAKLRFAPAVTLGDGESIDSWQQIALGWVDVGKSDEAQAKNSQNSSMGAARAAPPTAATPAKVSVNAGQRAAGGRDNSVTVHICVDEKGRPEHDPAIVQSSGVEALDQAALKIATAGSGYYRPLSPSDRPAMSGCAQLAIVFDAP